VTSRRGSACVRAWLTSGIARGIGAKIPEYNVCAVRLERLGAAEGEVHDPGDP
jgi:hypothetical protein